MAGGGWAVPAFVFVMDYAVGTHTFSHPSSGLIRAMVPTAKWEHDTVTERRVVENFFSFLPTLEGVLV